MNLFHSIVVILCVVCEFSSCNITLDSDRIVFGNDGNTDFDIGTQCIIDQSSSVYGSCQLISNCTEILKKMKAGQNNHTVCGYVERVQIVCCPLPSSTYNNTPIAITHERKYEMFDEDMYNNPCYYWSAPVYIEYVGETCIEEISGRPGKYRFERQCSDYNYNSQRLYTCCDEFVCCPDLISSSIHEQKCFDYGKLFFERKFQIAGPFNKNSADRCEVQFFVISGSEVPGGKYPFMAALGFEDGNGGINYDCGGTLISERYILTAAHCLSSPDFGPVVTVRLGVISLYELQKRYLIDYSVIERIPHPKYKKRFHYNDIALLLLDRPVEFNRFTRPACLPDSNEIPNHVTAMGWGITEDGIKSPNLLEVNVEIFSHEQCNQSYGVNRRINVGIVDETQVCAGSTDSRRDTCQGDSGGPLVSKHSKVYAAYIVVGITSMGRSCGTAGTPGVYTRVFPYMDWIQSIVWPTTV